MRAPLLKFLVPFAILPFLSSADTLRVAGSDLLADVLEPAFERYEASTGNAVEVSMYGTLPAKTAIAEGRADIALIAIPADEGLPEDIFKLTPLAYQVAYIYINNGNPTLELSLPQLSGMFSTRPQQRIERWSQAGQTGGIASRSVQPVIQDNDTVVVEMFKYIALDSTSIKSNTSYVKTVRELSDIIAADLGGIGVASQPAVGTACKAVAISKGDPGSFAFGPTPENVYYGDYLLRLPFYIAVPKDSSVDMKAFIQALLSAETTSEIQKSGFMPLPENVRKRTLEDLDR